MTVKSYFAATMQAALEKARAELGPEAMIVQSRNTPPENRALGECEVVCALMPETAAAAAPAPVSPPSPPSPATDRLQREMTELRRQMQAMHKAIARSVLGSEGYAPVPADFAPVFDRLLEAGLDRELAQDVIAAAVARAGNGGAASLDPYSAAAAELKARIEVCPRLQRGGEGTRMLALAGPPGSGKTTSIVKLAVRLGLAARRRVRLISADNFRVGGSEQLRSYATILGVAFQAVQSPEALEQALAAQPEASLVLIDTPGFGSREMDAAGELSGFFAGRPEIEVHLTLPASMKPADLSRAVEKFGIFRPSRLLFTRLDETDSFGTALSLAAALGKPLSFFGTGQRIPEDLETATAERAVELALGEEPRRSREAA